MGELLGDLERLAADLYPYRWPIAAVTLVVLAAIGTFAYRKGWHRVVLEHQRTALLIGTPVVVVVVASGWYLGSPLFIDKTVDEALPFDLAAAVESEGEGATASSEPKPAATGQAGPGGDAAQDEPPPTATPPPTPTPAPERTPTATPAPTNTPTAVIESAESSYDYESAAPTDTPVADVPTSTTTATPSPVPSPTATAVPTATATAAPTAAPEAAADDSTGAAKLKEGSFRDQDAFHKGSGQAIIFRGPDGSHLLRLEELDVTNGPDLHVILTPHRDPRDQGHVKAEGYVDLGKLKGNKGNQNYPIPATVDVGAQWSVVIYCVPFHVIFSVAQLGDAR